MKKTHGINDLRENLPSAVENAKKKNNSERDGKH